MFDNFNPLGFFAKTNIEDKNSNKELNNVVIEDDNKDGAVHLDNSSNNHYYRSDFTFTDQSDLIEAYHETANLLEVDEAIDNIVGDALTQDEDDSNPIDINLDNSKLSTSIKNKILDEWDEIMYLSGFSEDPYYHFREWYVDGKSAYQLVVNKEKLKEGIQAISKLDSRNITKIKNRVYDSEHVLTDTEEYYLYMSENSKKHSKTEVDRTKINNKSFRIPEEAITYVTSGLIDRKTGLSISHLHKAVKYANNLNDMETALVIYRISRASERRLWYIDVGDMQTNKANTYMRQIMNMYRNKTAYDPEKGTRVDKKRYMALQEDIFVPRKNGNSTEVSTLDGGQNLDQIADVEYFLTKLYKSLKVPAGRYESDSMAGFGRQAEISRDEIKFNKFIKRLRKRFVLIPQDFLKKQLLLKNIITREEWDILEKEILYVYSEDLHLEELRKNEMLSARVELAAELTDAGFVGTHFSDEYVAKDILRMTDKEVKEQQKLLDEEAAKKEEERKKAEAEEGGVEDEEDGVPGAGTTFTLTPNTANPPEEE